MTRPRLRLSIGGMLILVALIALGFAYLAPGTRSSRTSRSAPARRSKRAT